MRRFVRKLVKLTLALIVLLVIVAIAAVILFNPNNFKPQANKMLLNFTGQPFEIQGPISYVLWPKMIFKMHDISLTSPQVAIKQLTIDIDPYSLFGSTPIINMLDIQEAQVTIDNLNQLALPMLKTNQKIKKASVTKSVITLRNEANDQNWELRDLNLAGTNLLEPININGNLVNLKNAASFMIDGALVADPSQQTISVKPLNVTWNNTKVQGDVLISQYIDKPAVTGHIKIEPTNISELLKKLDPYFVNDENILTNVLQADLAYSYSLQDKLLDLSQLTIKLDDGSVTGNLKLSLNSPYRSEFQLNAENISFEPFGLLAKALFPSLPSNNLVPVEILKTITVMGKFSGTNLQLTPEFLANSLTMEANAQDGILQLNPIVLSAYEGTHNLNLTIDATAAEPIFKLNEQADNFPLEPITKLLNLPRVLSGNVKLKLNLEAQGNSKQALQQALTGGINIDVANGTVYGFDIAKLMHYVTSAVDNTFEQLPSNRNISLHDQLQPKILKWLDTQKNNPVSTFDTLNFKADIDHGIALNSSFEMQNAAYQFKGTGGFKLATDEINYTALLLNKADVTVTSNLKEFSALLKDTPLKVSLVGSFARPMLSPNIEEYATGILKEMNSVLLKKAASSMVIAAPVNDKTNKTAEEIFVDSLKGLSK